MLPLLYKRIIRSSQNRHETSLTNTNVDFKPPKKMTYTIHSGHYNITQTHLLGIASLVTFLSVSREKNKKINENQIKHQNYTN
jgi:hypothetical protein